MTQFLSKLFDGVRSFLDENTRFIALILANGEKFVFVKFLLKNSKPLRFHSTLQSEWPHTTIVLTLLWEHASSMAASSALGTSFSGRAYCGTRLPGFLKMKKSPGLACVNLFCKVNSFY
jgi:hypothetical protein